MGKSKRVIKEVLNHAPNNGAKGLQEGKAHRVLRASRKTSWRKQRLRFWVWKSVLPGTPGIQAHGVSPPVRHTHVFPTK